MFKTKQINKFLILSNILLIGFLLSTLISFNVLGNSDSDIIFTFENDVLFEKDNTDFYASFNIRNKTISENTENYEATYSFIDDPNGVVPNGWINESGIDCSTSIKDNLFGHEKILELNDINTNVAQISNTFIGQTSGTIEWWWMDISSSYAFIHIVGGGDVVIYLSAISNAYHYDLGGWQNVRSRTQNIWYHHRIDFECGAGGYMGLAAHTYDWYIDDILEADNIAFRASFTPDNITTFRITSSPAQTNYKFYFDGIGYYFPPKYTGIHYDVSEAASQWGLTWDGEFFWCTSAAAYSLFKYYANGTYTGFSFSTGNEDIVPRGSTWDGEYLWVVGDTNQYIYAYYPNGTYTGTSFNVSSEESDPYDVFWDGSNFWVIGFFQDNIYQYTSEGVYTGFNFDTHTQDNNPHGLVKINNHFWVLGSENDKVYKYTIEGDYTGANFYVGNEDIWPRGITVNETDLWIIGGNTHEIYKYPIITDYNIDDNKYPIIEINITNDYEPNTWEFTHKGLFEHFEDGDDNPNGWTDVEDGGDDVNCKEYGFKNNMLNGIVHLLADYGQTLGLQKNDFSNGNEIDLNVSFGFEIKDYYCPVYDNNIFLKVYSYDTTEIVRIWFTDEGWIKYWTGSSYVLLKQGLSVDEYYDVYLDIDYFRDECTLIYYTDGVFSDKFTFPLTTINKLGLSKVYFEIEAGCDSVEVYLDYIGVYINGGSLTTDYAYVGLHISDHSYWYFEEFNILKLDVIGNDINVYLTNAYYVSQMSPANQPEIIVPLNDYTGLEIYNVYDYLYDDYWGRDYIWGGVLWLIFNNTIKFNEISIEGVKMIEGENEYSLEFKHYGVDVMENYFYVDNNNKLYFSQTSNDNNLEYIEATFNIENVLSENYSMSYTSILTGNAQGHFRVFYTDTTSTLLPLRTYVSSPNVILPQDKNIYSFIILITDNDNDDVEGTTTGYITNVKLRYLVDVSINIITMTLLSIMIPLLILIVPTFLIHLRFGKKAIIPTFLLMSFICFITNLIPLWLFFIILLSSGVFIVAQKTIYKDEAR